MPQVQKRPPHSMWVLFETIILYFLTLSGLRLFSFKKNFSIISRNQWFLTDKPERIHQIRYYTAILNRMLRKKPNCLRDSLILFWATKEGVFHMAVKNEKTLSEAHAWVEWQGNSYTTNVELSEYTLIFSGQKNIT